MLPPPSRNDGLLCLVTIDRTSNRIFAKIDSIYCLQNIQQCTADSLQFCDLTVQVIPHDISYSLLDCS